MGSLLLVSVKHFEVHVQHLSAFCEQLVNQSNWASVSKKRTISLLSYSDLYGSSATTTIISRP